MSEELFIGVWVSQKQLHHEKPRPNVGSDFMKAELMESYLQLTSPPKHFPRDAGKRDG